VDEARAAISGRGVDLREMPFKELTFQGAFDARGQMVLTTSTSSDPLPFNGTTDKGLTYGRAMALTPLADADRARLDTLIALGQKLQGAAPVNLAVEILDAKAAKARETGLSATALTGTVIYQKRRNDSLVPMFAPQTNGRYRWTKEPLSLRLAEPVRGKAIYYKGLGPTDNLTVVVNGVHRARIDAVAQLGAAVVALPADLEVLDLRLEAGGTAQARGVVLVK
jgi:hypothetical protein